MQERHAKLIIWRQIPDYTRKFTMKSGFVLADCNKCNKKVQLSKLKEHRCHKRNHTEKHPYACKLCNKIFQCTEEYSWKRVTFCLQIVQKRCFSLIIRRKSDDTRWITLEKSPISANCAKRHSLDKITQENTLMLANCATRNSSRIKIWRDAAQNNTRRFTMMNDLVIANCATRCLNFNNFS